MAIEVINRGTSDNDGTGDNIREAFRKVNDNFDQVLTNDTTDYTDATTPLAGTEIALVEQGGTFKKVAVSEFGGSETLEDLAYEGSKYFNDFIGTYASNLNDGTFIVANSGGFLAGAVDAGIIPNKGHILQFATSTSATAWMSFRTSSTGQYFLGNSLKLITSVRLDLLSDGTNNFVIKFGATTDVNTKNIGSNGFGIIYDKIGETDVSGAVASDNWRFFTKDGASITLFDSGIAVNNTVYTDLKVFKHLDNSAIDFYINEVLIHTITTNIPTENSALSPVLWGGKTLGTTQRIFRSDFLGMEIKKQ